MDYMELSSALAALQWHYFPSELSSRFFRSRKFPIVDPQSFPFLHHNPIVSSAITIQLAPSLLILSWNTSQFTCFLWIAKSAAPGKYVWLM